MNENLILFESRSYRTWCAPTLTAPREGGLFVSISLSAQIRSWCFAIWRVYRIRRSWAVPRMRVIWPIFVRCVFCVFCFVFCFVVVVFLNPPGAVTRL